MVYATSSNPTIGALIFRREHQQIHLLKRKNRELSNIDVIAKRVLFENDDLAAIDDEIMRTERRLTNFEMSKKNRSISASTMRDLSDYSSDEKEARVSKRS